VIVAAAARVRMRVRDMTVLQGMGFGTHWSEVPGKRFNTARLDFRRMCSAAVCGQSAAEAVVIAGIKVPLTTALANCRVAMATDSKGV
jgi:hypothetical protein